MAFTIDQIVREMGKALVRGEGTYFLGSGISRGSGLPDWFGLVNEIAAPLGLTLSTDDDFARIAQYCINEDNGNRGPLIGRLKHVFSRSPQRPNQYHVSINRTRITSIWTTNFDTLLEESLAKMRVAVRACDSDITNGTGDFDVELLKIHGCVNRSKPEELVLTQEDYENFAVLRPALSERLRHDLIHKSILFAGYSYRDPNIATMLVEARRLAKGATREHFFVTKQEPNPTAARRQELWHSDLLRFGIRTAFIATYDELGDCLKRLALASRGKSVFITGSHTVKSSLATELGHLLATQTDAVLLDGQSSGIGREAANAFGTTCVQLADDIRNRIRYFPNPYTFNPQFANDKSLLGMLKQWRANLFRAAHSVVVFDGGMGTDAEVELAREMNCVIVPVLGAPGGATDRLLNDPTVTQSLSTTYVMKARSGSTTAQDIVDCLLETFPK